MQAEKQAGKSGEAEKQAGKAGKAGKAEKQSGKAWGKVGKDLEQKLTVN